MPWKSRSEPDSRLGKIWDARGDKYYEDTFPNIGLVLWSDATCTSGGSAGCANTCRPRCLTKRFMTEDALSYQAFAMFPVDSLGKGRSTSMRSGECAF